MLVNDLFKLIKDHFYVLGSTLPDITGDHAIEFYDPVKAQDISCFAICLAAGPGAAVRKKLRQLCLCGV